MKTKSKDKGRLILRFLQGNLHYFLLGVGFALLSSLLEMIAPQIVSYTVDSVIGNQESTLPGWVLSLIEKIGGASYLRENLWVIAVCVAIVALATALFKYFFQLMNAKGAETLIKRMRDLIFSHIIRLPFSFHGKHKTGDIIQRCTSDVNTVKNFLSEQLVFVFRIAMLLTFALIFMFSMNVPLALAACAYFPFIMGYSLLFHRKIGKGFQACDETEGVVSAIVQENLTGVRVVRAFGRERSEQEKFITKNGHYAQQWIRLCRTMATFWASSDLLSGLQVMTVVVLGAVFCVNGRMSSGQYIAFIAYNALLVWPIRQLGRIIADFSKAGVSLERIHTIMAQPEETDPPGAISPDLHRDIDFSHVRFSYDDGTPVLSDITLHIPAGSTLGILGGTGSGKSTLVELLARLYPLQEGGGRITIGGADIANMKRQELRRGVGIVLQEPFLFSRTLRENIAITDDESTMTDIKTASAIACLDETIEKFVDGYETAVGERGVTLSGGQKQRVAIARLLMQKTPIMVFDDSLSAVDTETDAKIRRALKETMADSTVILISHRITTLMGADNIAVLDRGRLVECGTHAQLMAKGGIYRKIADIQFGTAGEVTT